MIWLLVIALAQLACHQQPVLPVWTNLDTGDAFSPPYEVFHSGQRRVVNNCASAIAAVREGEPESGIRKDHFRGLLAFDASDSDNMSL